LEIGLPDIKGGTIGQFFASLSLCETQKSLLLLIIKDGQEMFYAGTKYPKT
jgi:hypothetical protein